ncbi:MAG: CehA/McbA family metallohydrolase [Gemmatimonadaceae bacterium]
MGRPSGFVYGYFVLAIFMLSLDFTGSRHGVVHAQRAPVLKQIDVPHPYYYREMYLPQVTSGPSSVAWSPDGQELIYAMQGTLWRQRLGSDDARQLTSGPGYDYQPDWSPDGRHVAYSSYVNDAIELRLLDLKTGASRAIVANGAVNVEPRWSPDGSRIAFVSTAHNSRWNIHVVTLRDGGVTGIERITEGRDSGLPRYYYSRFDHAISPTWSPDGDEVIFVSNRGHIWGSGGFWRAPARAGADSVGREIRYEETTWRARPDWSADGRRVVYSSYLGRQWHQLWLMTSDGGDPFPISYGEFDATNPRWSRDGSLIAYISNETGNTSLWVMRLPEGRRQRVEAKTRTYVRPMGRVKLVIRDKETGRAVAARVSLTSTDGRSFAPDDAWRHADDGFDRGQRRYEYSYFHTRGDAEVMVVAGQADVEVMRGLEYRPVRRVIRVPADSVVESVIELERIADLPSTGWFSGDLHVHMNYGGNYRNTPPYLATQADAEDLHVVENLIVNKEQRIPDIAYFTGKPDSASTRQVVIAHGQEFHTSFWGHTGLLGLRDHILLPDYAGYVNTAAASLYPSNTVVFDLAREQGATVGYVHPFDTEPNPALINETLTHALPIEAALGKLDYLEVVGFSDHLATAKVWYRLLNCGFRIPAGAGTDAMANFSSLRGPVGMSRVFVQTEGTLTHDRWLEGLRAGRTFATNGPLLEFTLAGKSPGGEVRLDRGEHELEVRATLRSIVAVDHLELIGNGRVIAEIQLTGGRTAASATRKFRVSQSGWYTLRAWSDSARHPVLDIYPFATTSPIYVTVGGTPVRSRVDAEYFVSWIDRLITSAGAHTGWNSARERQEVLEQLEQAREVFYSRGARRPGSR